MKSESFFSPSLLAHAPWILILSLLAIVGTVVFLSLARGGWGRKNPPPSHLSIEDPQALARAEHLLRAQGTHYAPILRVDSGHGYRDSNLVEWVAFLGSRDIDATYESYGVGELGGAIQQFILKVEKGKEKEALQALREEGFWGASS